MSVFWNWNCQMGTIECNDNNKDYTLTVYQGNCLCVILYEKSIDNRKIYEFKTFFNDVEHLKKCIGLKAVNGIKKENLFINTWKKWRLNTYFKDSITMAKYLTQAGYPVELYYEEVKE